MWTICWTEFGRDRWERLNTPKEMWLYILEQGLEWDGDVIIFPPSDNEMGVDAFKINHAEFVENKET